MRRILYPFPHRRSSAPRGRLKSGIQLKLGIPRDGRYNGEQPPDPLPDGVFMSDLFRVGVTRDFLRPDGTVGYGDVTLPVQWRVLGAIEAASGVILLGWSTAFFVSVVSRIRALEHDWRVEPAGPR